MKSAFRSYAFRRDFNASLSRLKARALNLFSKEEMEMVLINHQNTTVLNTPHGSEIRSLIDRTNSDIELCSLAEEVLPPGKAVRRHHHLQTEEIYYILHGEGEMTVGSETQKVKTGDAIFIPRTKTHTLKNTSNEPIRLLLVCGPAYSITDHLIEMD
jgi:mannose-6-phosphate isomerase-like protein (cupin superfamily)